MNELCLEYPKLEQHAIPLETYGNSAKLAATSKLLDQLQQEGSRWSFPYFLRDGTQT